MIRIEYPSHPFKIREKENKTFIFDELRKLWLKLTPEEWVRQNFLQYLIKIKRYPATWIAIEKKIQLGEMVKRFDILVYDRHQKPWMMVECKEMDIPLNQAVLEQVLRYNISVPVRYLVITNGSFCVGYEKIADQLQLLTELPSI